MLYLFTLVIKVQGLVTIPPTPSLYSKKKHKGGISNAK